MLKAPINTGHHGGVARHNAPPIAGIMLGMIISLILWTMIIAAAVVID